MRKNKRTLAKNADGKYDETSFNNLFNKNRELINIRHNKPLDIDDISVGGMKSLSSITKFIAEEFADIKSGKPRATGEEALIRKDTADELAHQYKIAETSNISIYSILPAKELVKTTRQAVGVNDEDLVKNKDFRDLKDEMEKTCHSRCATFKDFIKNLDRELSSILSGPSPHRRVFRPNSRG